MGSTDGTKQHLGPTVMTLWIVFFCVAVLVSVVCLALKAKVYMELMRRRRREFEDTASEDAYTRKHSARLEDARKTIRMAFASLVAGLLEDLPFGVLGLVYLKAQMDMHQPVGLLLLLSIASSFFMLGIKLCKLPLLKGLWDEEKKQKRKQARAAPSGAAHLITPWLRDIGQLAEYVDLFERAGMVTADAIVNIDSDAPLIEIGMDDEVDRKYLLLQLARVRKRASFASSALLGRAEGGVERTHPAPPPPRPDEPSSARAGGASGGRGMGSIEMQPMPERGGTQRAVC